MPPPVDILMLDFDGTLTDSIPPAVEAVQEMLTELSLPYRSKAEINRYVGYGEIPLISGAIGSKDPALLKKAMGAYERIYMQKGLCKIPLYPHVREFLEYFRNKTKVIISNKKDAFIKIVLDNHGLTSYFSDMFGGDTAPCLKPDPCTINKVLKKYNISRERAIFIGDMTVDIETGRNAKVLTCAVTYGFDSREKLEKMRPDYLIEDILDLKDLIA